MRLERDEDDEKDDDPFLLFLLHLGFLRQRRFKTQRNVWKWNEVFGKCSCHGMNEREGQKRENMKWPTCLCVVHAYFCSHFPFLFCVRFSTYHIPNHSIRRFLENEMVWNSFLPTERKGEKGSQHNNNLKVISLLHSIVCGTRWRDEKQKNGMERRKKNEGKDEQTNSFSSLSFLWIFPLSHLFLESMRPLVILLLILNYIYSTIIIPKYIWTQWFPGYDQIRGGAQISMRPFPWDLSSSLLPLSFSFGWIFCSMSLVDFTVWRFSLGYTEQWL